MHLRHAPRFPDFSLLGAAPPGQPGDLTALIDAVLISHAHIDHVGALPYLTEARGADSSQRRPRTTTPALNSLALPPAAPPLCAARCAATAAQW